MNQKKLYIKIKILVILLFIFAVQSITAQDKPIETDSLSIPKDSINVDSTSVNKSTSNKIKSPINFSAKDSMKLSLKTKLVYAYGEGNLEMEDMKLEAGYIKLNMDSDYIYAKTSKEEIEEKEEKKRKKPHFTQGSEEFDVETIRYNFKTKKGIITNVVTEQQGQYLHAEKSKIHPNKETHIINGKFTTCDADHPHFYIRLTKAKVIPDDKIISGPFYFVIADIPIPIGLPFGWFPSQNENASGIILPSFTEEERRGFGLTNGGYYWAINDYVNLTVQGEAWTSKSWGINAISQYKKRYKYNGNFNVKYMENVIEDPVTKTEGKNTMFNIIFNYTRDPKANPTSSFNTSLNITSSEFAKFNSYDPSVTSRNTSSSSIAYTKSWPGLPFNFSANMSANQNLTDKTINMEMPTLTFNMNKQYPFKGKSSAGSTNWYKKIGVGFSSNFRNSLNVYESSLSEKSIVDSMENGFKYNIPIGTNFKIFQFIIVSPNINYTGRIYKNYVHKKWFDYENDTTQISGYYNDTIDAFNHHMDFSFSVPFSTKLYGLVQFKKGRIAAIRHVASPSISLSYRPDFSEDYWGYYKTDPADTTGNKKYSQYLNGIYGTAGQGKSGMMNFSLANNFEMKVHSRDTSEDFKKIILLESFNLNTGYNLAADSLKWSPISISASTKLLKQISVQYSGSINLYTINKTTGGFVDETYFDKYGVLGHLSSSRLSLGGTLSSETFKKKTSNDNNQNTNNQNANNNNLMKNNKGQSDFGDDFGNNKGNDLSVPDRNEEQTGEFSFNVPWSLNLNYSWNFNSRYNTILQEFEPEYTQTINMRGNLSLTPKWKVGGSLQYDIQERKVVYTSMNLYRDLHCWEMSLSFVPFGTYKSFNFRINIKSSIFKDVEFKRQDSWRDNVDF